MWAQAVQLLLEAPPLCPSTPSPPLSRAQGCGLASWLRVAWAQAEAGQAIGGARLSVCLCLSAFLWPSSVCPLLSLCGVPGRRGGVRRCQKPL